MKKLIIAVSAVVLGFAANAAALSWSTWGFINDGSADSDWITGGMAYLVQVTDTATFAVADDLKVTGGTIVDNLSFTDGSVFGAWNDTSSLVDGTKYYFAIIATTEGAGADVPTTGLYGVDRNGGNASDFYEVTWDASTGGAFEPDGEFGGFAMATAVSGGSPIPEPTSGLLMLLGMAGLALRRKQK